MDNPYASGRTDLEWVDVDACTLPTSDRPLRLAEFDDLFATSLHAVERTGDLSARMTFGAAADGADLADHIRALAAAETACCSFFTFTVTQPATGAVALDVEVPAAYADALAALVARARATSAVAS